MISIANTLEEAIKHFCYNNSPICCINKKRELTCHSLKESFDFFKNKPKKIRNKVRPMKK
jgi:hypothetical protein